MRELSQFTILNCCFTLRVYGVGLYRVLYIYGYHGKENGNYYFKVLGCDSY